jgi:hypothetical protein
MQKLAVLNQPQSPLIPFQDRRTLVLHIPAKFPSVDVASLLFPVIRAFDEIMSSDWDAASHVPRCTEACMTFLAAIIRPDYSSIAGYDDAKDAVIKKGIVKSGIKRTERPERISQERDLILS